MYVALACAGLVAAQILTHTKYPASRNSTITTKEKNIIEPPSGGFVSSHKVYVNSPENIEESTCMAKKYLHCKIIFTKQGKTVELPTRRLNELGMASWAWSPRQIGLTVGEWDITALLTEVVSAPKTKDPLKLTVYR